MLNRRMPNGMYGGVRGERKPPLLDWMSGLFCIIIFEKSLLLTENQIIMCEKRRERNDAYNRRINETIRYKNSGRSSVAAHNAGRYLWLYRAQWSWKDDHNYILLRHS